MYLLLGPMGDPPKPYEQEVFEKEDMLQVDMDT